MKKVLTKIVSIISLFSFIYNPTFCYSTSAFQSFGIDVSQHNGRINWPVVRDAGVDFAVIRTGYGRLDWEDQTDKELRNNINGAKAAGILLGAYHHSYATNVEEAELEAKFFINRLKWNDKWEYPVFIDLEDECQEKLSPKQKMDVVLAFINKVNSAGYYSGLYTFLRRCNEMFPLLKKNSLDLWIAHWNNTCKCLSDYTIWQFTANGRVLGIRDTVDLSYCYVDYPSLMRKLHKNGF